MFHNTIRKTICLILCVALVLTATFSSFAADVTRKINNIDQNDIKRISEVFVFEYNDPYGPLSTCADIDDIWLGCPVDAFSAEKQGLKGLDAVIYPLFSGTRLCAYVFVKDDCVQIDVPIANEINALGLSQNKFSFIYDSENLYAYDLTGLHWLHEFNKVNGRVSLIELQESDLLNIPFVEKSTQDYRIDLKFDEDILESILSTSYYLGVGYYNQPTSYNICWACSDVCIGRYLTSSTVSAYGFALTYVSDPYTGQNINQSLQHLNDYFDLDYDYGVYSYGVPSITQILSYLGYSYPLYGSFLASANSSANGHATVIRGASSSNNYLSIMDPNYNNAYRTAYPTTINSVDTWYFYNTTSGVTTYWYLTDVGKPNW